MDSKVPRSDSDNNKLDNVDLERVTSDKKQRLKQ